MRIMMFKGITPHAAALSLLLMLTLGCPPQAYEPEYWVDTHGAAGVAMFLGEIRTIDPSYDPYYFGGLDWLVATAIWQGDMCGWVLDPDAQQGDPNYRITRGEQYIITGLINGYLASGNTAYRDTALGSLKLLLDWATPDEGNPYGPGYSWGTRRAGHTWGPGLIGDVLVTAYNDLPGTQTLVTPYLQGLCYWLLDQAVIGDDGLGNPTVMWPEEEGGTAYETGYCYGNAGILAFLINAAMHFPTLTFPAGSPVNDLREFSNASTRWLLSEAEPYPGPDDGIIWRYMRHSELSDNVGFGSGVSGIGVQLLDMHALNKTADPAFAALCLENAGKAASTVIHEINEATSIQQGMCGGEGGVHLFLLPLADEVEGTDPQLAQACRDAVGRVADFVVASRITFHGERTGWKAGTHLHAQAVNVALDYGVTGLGLVLYQAGTELGRQDLVVVAGKAAEYIRFITRSAAQEGYKWLKLVPYGPTDTDGDGVFDDWDEYPGDPDRVWD